MIADRYTERALRELSDAKALRSFALRPPAPPRGFLGRILEWLHVLHPRPAYVPPWGFDEPGKTIVIRRWPVLTSDPTVKAKA